MGKRGVLLMSRERKGEENATKVKNMGEEVRERGEPVTGREE